MSEPNSIELGMNFAQNETLAKLHEERIIDINRNPGLEGLNPFALELFYSMRQNNDLNSLEYEQCGEVCTSEQIEAMYVDDFRGSSRLLKEHGKDAIREVAYAQNIKRAYVNWFNENYGDQYGRLHVLHLPGDGLIIAGSAFATYSLGVMMDLSPDSGESINGSTKKIHLASDMRRAIIFNPELTETNENPWENRFVCAEGDNDQVIIKTYVDTDSRTETVLDELKSIERSGITGGINLNETQCQHLDQVLQQTTASAQITKKDAREIASEFVSKIEQARAEDGRIDYNRLREHGVEIESPTPSPDSIAFFVKERFDQDGFVSSQDHWYSIQKVMMQIRNIETQDVSYTISREGTSTAVVLSPNNMDQNYLEAFPGSVTRELLGASNNPNLTNTVLVLTQGKSFRSGALHIVNEINQGSKVSIASQTCSPLVTDTEVAAEVYCIADMVPPRGTVGDYSELDDYGRIRLETIEEDINIEGENPQDKLANFITKKIDLFMQPAAADVLSRYATLLDQLTKGKYPEHFDEILRSIEHHCRIAVSTHSDTPQRVIDSFRYRYQAIYTNLESREEGMSITPRQLLSFARHFGAEMRIDSRMARLMGVKLEELQSSALELERSGLGYYDEQDESRSFLVPYDIKQADLDWEDLSSISSQILSRVRFDESNPTNLLSLALRQDSNLVESVAIANRIVSGMNRENPALVLAVLETKYRDGLSHPYTLQDISLARESADNKSIIDRLRLHELQVQFDRIEEVEIKRSSATGTLNKNLNRTIYLTEEMTKLARKTTIVQDPIAVEILIRCKERIESLIRSGRFVAGDMTIAQSQVNIMNNILLSMPRSQHSKVGDIYENLTQDLHEVEYKPNIHRLLAEISSVNKNTNRGEHTRIARTINQILKSGIEVIHLQSPIKINAPFSDEIIELQAGEYSPSYITILLHKAHSRMGMPPDISARYAANLTEAVFVSEIVANKGTRNEDEGIRRAREFTTTNIISSLKTRDRRLIFLAMNNHLAMEYGLAAVGMTEKTKVNTSNIENLASNFLENRQYIGNDDILYQLFDSLHLLYQKLGGSDDSLMRRIEEAKNRFAPVT